MTATFQGSTSNTMGVNVAGVMEINPQMVMTTVSIKKGKKKKNQKFNPVQETLKVMNNTGQAIQGPMYFVADCLSAGWTMQNATGITKGSDPAVGDPLCSSSPATASSMPVPP